MMDESVQRLNQEQRKLQMHVFLLIGILLGAAVTAFMKMMPFSFGLALGALFYRLFIFRKMQSRYETMVNDENLRLTTCRALRESTLDSTGGAGLTQEMVAAADLLPHFVPGKSPYGAYKGISGRDGKTKAIVADVALNDSTRQANGRTKGFVNCGCWIHLEFQEKKELDFRVLGDGTLAVYLKEDFEAAHPDMKAVPATETGISEDMTVYADPGKAGALPGEEFFRKLRNLADYTPAELWLSVRENHMDVYLKDRFLALPVNVKASVTKESLLFDPLPELKRILDLSETL